MNRADRRATSRRGRTAPPDHSNLLPGAALVQRLRAPLTGWRGGVLAFVMIWAALIGWRWEIIATPPYWDSAMGLFVEADFLARTGFDYGQLVSSERRFIEGGTAIYIISIMPTLVALAMVALPSTHAVLVAGHLFTFAMAAVLLLLMFSILKPAIGDGLAALICLALVTTPLEAAQIDMIGMDLPMTVGALAALWCVTRERYLAAVLLSLATVFIKISGGIVTAALIVYFAILIVVTGRGPRLSQNRRLWIALGASLLALAFELAAINWSIGLPNSGVEKMESDVTLGMASLAMTRYWCPDLIVLLGVGLALAVIVLGVEIRERLRREPGIKLRQRIWPTCQGLVFAQRYNLVCWIVVLGTLMVLSRIYTIPRYLTLPLAFLWVSIGLMLFGRLRLYRMGTVLVALVIAFNVLNLSGRFFPPIASLDLFDARTGALLERSLEYLADHRQNLALARYLEREAGDRHIVAPNPYVHFLSLPILGYVTKPLNGYAVNTFVTPTFHPVMELRGAVPTDLVFVWAANRFTPLAQCALPRPEATDRIFYPTAGRTDSLAVFAKTFPGVGRGESLKEAYSQLLWPGANVFAAADKLAVEGKYAAAMAAYQQALALEPLRIDGRLRYAALLVHENEPDAALREYEFVIEQSSHDVPVLKLMAELQVSQGHLDDAVRSLERALERDAADSDTLVRLGILYGRRHELARAYRSFRRAVRANPADPRAHYLMAMTMKQRGFPDEAIAEWKNIVNRSPEHVESLTALGEAMRESGEYAGAVGYFRRALQARPGWPSAANSLAWVLATCPRDEVRNGAEAVQLASVACQQSGDHPSYQDTLAAAYAESQQFDQAIATAEHARELALHAGSTVLADKIEGRLKLYRSQRPFREQLPR